MGSLGTLLANGDPSSKDNPPQKQCLLFCLSKTLAG
jgi:hypothetical protein